VEIKTYRALTESRGAEKPAERSLLNGPPRAQSKAQAEYSATFGTRELPGICWYPARVRGFSSQIKVAPRIFDFNPSLTFIVEDGFFIF